MQKKPSYRYLQWILLAGAAAALAPACVVTSDGGDDDDDFFDGGEGGTSTAGKTSSGGAGTAGKTSSGGAGAAGTTTGGTGGTAAGTGGTAAGTGGTAGGSSYVAGLCEDDAMEPSMVPNCDPDAKDAKDACRKCMRAQCCDEWQTCFGDTPTIACGWGPTEDADGQFDCIRNCFAANENDETDPDALLGDCSAGCAVQCDGPDNGLLMGATNDLVTCANDVCATECFPFQ